MGMLAWFKDNWAESLQTFCIVGSLLFAAYTIRLDEKSRRVETLLSLTSSHRKIWASFYERPELARILSSTVDVDIHPVTKDEEMFTNLVFLHASAAFTAIREKLFDKPHGLEEDLATFVSLPIPRIVWQQMKGFYEPDFVNFVNRCAKIAPIEKR